jgi:acyl-coenzyme A thioesterase 9
MDSPTIKVVSHLRDVGGGNAGNAAIDAGGSARKPLSLWPGMYHSPVTNALWEARSSIFERKMDVGAAGAAAGPQTELLTKTPAQSRTAIAYKFAQDDILREQYRDAWNEVRIGKLLEDLDALAGTIAVKVFSLLRSRSPYLPVRIARVSDIHELRVVCDVLLHISPQIGTSQN